MIWIIIFDFFTLDFQVRFSNRDPGWGWFFSNRFKLVLSRISLPKPIGSWYLVAIFGKFNGSGNGEKSNISVFLIYNNVTMFLVKSQSSSLSDAEMEKKIRHFHLFVFWLEKSNLFPLPVRKLATGVRKYAQFFLVKSQSVVLDLFI